MGSIFSRYTNSSQSEIADDSETSPLLTNNSRASDVEVVNESITKILEENRILDVADLIQLNPEITIEQLRKHALKILEDELLHPQATAPTRGRLEKVEYYIKKYWLYPAVALVPLGNWAGIDMSIEFSKSFGKDEFGLSGNWLIPVFVIAVGCYLMANLSIAICNVEEVINELFRLIKGNEFYKKWMPHTYVRYLVAEKILALICLAFAVPGIVSFIAQNDVGTAIFDSICQILGAVISVTLLMRSLIMFTKWITDLVPLLSGNTADTKNTHSAKVYFIKQASELLPESLRSRFSPSMIAQGYNHWLLAALDIILTGGGYWVTSLYINVNYFKAAETTAEDQSTLMKMMSLAVSVAVTLLFARAVSRLTQSFIAKTINLFMSTPEVHHTSHANIFFYVLGLTIGAGSLGAASQRFLKFNGNPELSVTDTYLNALRGAESVNGGDTVTVLTRFLDWRSNANQLYDSNVTKFAAALMRKFSSSDYIRTLITPTSEECTLLKTNTNPTHAAHDDTEVNYDSSSIANDFKPASDSSFDYTPSTGGDQQTANDSNGALREGENKRSTSLDDENGGQRNPAASLISVSSGSKTVDIPKEEHPHASVLGFFIWLRDQCCRGSSPQTLPTQQQFTLTPKGVTIFNTIKVLSYDANLAQNRNLLQVN